MGLLLSANDSQYQYIILWQVELEATTEDPGTTLRAPTAESGLSPACKDTCYGILKLQMWERRYDGSKGKVPSYSHIIVSLWIWCFMEHSR